MQVVYAGHETKAMLNNTGPRSKRSKLERQMNYQVRSGPSLRSPLFSSFFTPLSPNPLLHPQILYCVLILVVLCVFGGVADGIWTAQRDYKVWAGR